MAKSIRSKRKRMLRTIKRERYAAKELKRLKEMLNPKGDTKSDEVEMIDSDSVKVVNAEDIKNAKKKAAETSNIQTESVCNFREVSTLPSSSTRDEIEMDHSQKLIFNKKTMKDQHGNYPTWFNQRKLKKMKQIRRKAQKGKRKKNGQIH